jgi:hypothetical protein
VSLERLLNALLQYVQQSSLPCIPATMATPVPGKVNYLKGRFRAEFDYVSNTFDARASGLTHALGHAIIVLTRIT